MTGSIEIQQFQLWDKLKRKRMPVSFEIEATARCNNDCTHCYINLPAGDRSAAEREMTAAEISDIADQSVRLGAVWCLLTGGEPLLRTDFEEIYMSLKQKGLLVTVFTNATLIKKEHIALFRKYPPRDLEITVYGVTHETYEAVTRRAGSFDMFINGLNLLTENGLHIRLKSMAIRSNLREHNAIAEFCSTRTKDYYRFDPQLHLRFDGNPLRNAEIRAERLTPEQIIALELGDRKRIDAMRDQCDILISDKYTHYGCNRLFHCSAGGGSFTVGYDGRFRLCSSLHAEGTTYDLRTGSLDYAWRNFVPRIRDLRSSRMEYLDSCRKCALMNLCMWCPAHAHLETGDLDGQTPYFCEVAHRRAENIQET